MEISQLQRVVDIAMETGIASGETARSHRGN
jgi:hypothetical protein